MPHNQEKEVILIIADISGYTRFMLSNQESIFHAQIIITQLTKSIINQIEIPLEISKLEGDAIFLYAAKENESTWAEICEQISLKLALFFQAFSDKLSELTDSNTCDCKACRNMARLKLKVVVHCGRALFYKLDKFEELSGVDVIIVHRLLKNSVNSDEYLLMTEAAYQYLCFPPTLKVIAGEETYNELGTIKTYVANLINEQDIEAKSVRDERYSSAFYQFKNELLKMWRLMLINFGLSKQAAFKNLPVGQPLSTVSNSHIARLMTLLRLSISVVLIIGGIKLAFPANPEALALTFIHPESGYISPFFAEQVTQRLGLSIASFLQMMGMMELITATMLAVWGGHTAMVGGMTALMFWFFTIANPIIGPIRLSRDLALMGLSIATALTGPAAWDAEGRFERKDAVLLIIRLSLAYTLITSALFSGGAFANPLNSTLPIELVLFLGLLLVLGLLTRPVMGFIFLWLLVIIGASLWEQQSLYMGLEATKRELGLLAGAFIYSSAGRDRFSWPKPRPEADEGRR